MDALAVSLVERLDASRPFAELLATVGDPEPKRAAAAFARAARHPDLAASRGAWLPVLLRGARPGFGTERFETKSVVGGYKTAAKSVLVATQWLPRAIKCSAVSG